MTKYVEFCKTINGMFKDAKLDEKIDNLHRQDTFWLNGYVNKQNYWFWGSKEFQYFFG